MIAPATLESIAAELRNVQVNMDILREHVYEDHNTLVAYINDIQYSWNGILEQLDSLWHEHRRTNDHLRSLEVRVEHIYFHMHEHVGYFATQPVIPPNPPP